MALIMPDLATHALNVIRAKAVGTFVAIHFGYAPSPDRLIITPSTGFLHMDLLPLLQAHGHVDFLKFQSGSLGWLRGDEASIAAYQTNPAELGKLDEHIRQELLREIRRRI